MGFLSNKYARVVSVFLLLEAAAFYAVASRPETVPPIEPLALFPGQLQSWRVVEDVPFDQATLDLLRADDTLNRVYAEPGARVGVNLFIAYFKTQRYGQSPHSPKNCLPGSGWDQLESGRQTISVADWDAPIVVNRYVVEHGDEKSVTLYWYQSHHHIIASELGAKFWLVADAIRYHRSDTALVRVIVPVRNDDRATAVDIGVRFIQAAFPEILRQMPL